MYAAVIYNLNMIKDRRRLPLYCLILFPSLPPRLQPQVVICTRQGAKDVALPEALCVPQHTCFNVLFACMSLCSNVFSFVLMCGHIISDCVFCKWEQHVCACLHLCWGVYTEQSVSPDHLISLHLIMGLFYLGFQLLCFSGKWFYAWQDLPEAL